MVNLEVGKRYKDLVGDVWNVTGITNDINFPFAATCVRLNREEWFEQDGSFFREAFEEHEWDLVEELEEPVLEYKKYYSDAAGNVWCIDAVVTDSGEDEYRCIARRLDDGLCVRLTKCGRYFLGECSEYDLIKEVPAPISPTQAMNNVITPKETPLDNAETARLAEKFMLHFLSVRGWVDENDINKLADLAVKTARILQGKLK